MPQLPLIDLLAQYRDIKPEVDQAIQGVLNRGQFILGPEVEAFEREVAAYCDTAHAVAVASGTDALELALRAVGVGPGDEVITTAFSFFATAEAIALVGARPRFIDIEPRTYNLDMTQLEAAVTPRTKALIPVHLYGLPCDMDVVLSVARAHRLKVIEDCAQAFGARYRERRVGSFGDAAAFSFFPTKNLGGYGDGGMVVTHDAGIAERIRVLRTHGSTDKATHSVLGCNSRLDELQAAILRVKLRHVDDWNARRRTLAGAYRDAFIRAQMDERLLPSEPAGADHVYHLFVVRVPDRQQVMEALARAGIASQVHYAMALPRQPALAAYWNDQQTYLQADEAAQRVLSLPFYPELPHEALERVVNVVARAIKTRSQ